MTHQNIFNDNFVASVADELMDFELPVTKKTGGEEDDDNPPPLATENIQRLASLFSPPTHTVTPTLNNFYVSTKFNTLINLFYYTMYLSSNSRI